MKRKILLFLSLSLILPLSGCSYKNTSSLMVERSLKDEYVNLSFDGFKDKCTNLDNFIAFFNSEECSACYYLETNFLDDFIKETHLKIYSLEVYDITSYEMAYFTQISSEKQKFYELSKDENNVEMANISYPLMLVIEQGKVSSYAIGTKKISRKFFFESVYIDQSKEEFICDGYCQISLENSENPTFIEYSEELKNGIVYRTSTLENDEVKYYLKPFMEDYQVNIYVDIDSSLSENKLEILKTDTIVGSSSKKESYLELIKTYVKL